MAIVRIYTGADRQGTTYETCLDVVLRDLRQAQDPGLDREDHLRVDAAGPSGVATTLAPAGWYPDPTERYEHRFWDGTDWSSHVASQGAAALDPM